MLTIITIDRYQRQRNIVTSAIDKNCIEWGQLKMEWKPSGLHGEELEKEIKRLEEESKHMTEWPDVDKYYD